MSIETEFESTITNVKNAYQGLDNLGATIPENKTIENIKSCLDEIYNKFPKTSYAEGTEITLSNTLKGKLDFENNIVGYGQTEQESTDGNQLIPYTLETLKSFNTNGTWKDNVYTYANTTITVNEDMSLTINGTTTGMNFNLVNEGNSKLQSGEYTLSCIGRIANLGIYVNKASADRITQIGSSDAVNVTTKTFTLSEETTLFRAYIYIVNGTTFDNVTIYPMIYSGTTTKDYEPYTDGPAPNPSYPFPIEVVRGKNLWGGGNFVNGTKFNTKSDGSIEYKLNNESGSSATTPLAIESGIIKKLQAGTYTITFTGLISTIYANIVKRTPNTTSGSVFKTLSYDNTTVTFTITEEIEYFCRIQADNAITASGTVYIQLEKDSTATSYLPYNTVEIEESGKNLFDGEMEEGAINGASGVPNTSTTAIRSKNYTNVSNIRKIAILGNDGTTKTKVIFAYDKDNHYLGNATVSNNNIFDLDTITLGNQTSYYSSNADIYNLKFVVANTTDLTINYGILDNSTTYEPYQEPKTYQLSLGEYEFARIGNYVDYIWTDRSTGKWYKKEVIGKKILNGSEYWVAIKMTNVYGYYFSANIKPNESSSSLTGSLCNSFTEVTPAQNWATPIGNNNFAILNNNGWARFTKGEETNNLENFKNWLANNNVILYYILATATDTEITDTTLIEQLNNWYNSQSFTGTTIIEIDGQLPLILKVRALKG